MKQDRYSLMPRATRSLAVLLAIACLLPDTLAQEDGPRPETQPVSRTQPESPPPATSQVAEPEATAAVPRREDLQNHIAQIQAASDLQENVKSELVGLYRQALEQLTVAESREAKIKEFENGRQRAPESLKEVKARIEQATSQPSTRPALRVSPDDTLEVLGQTLASKEAELRAVQDTVKSLDEEAGNRGARKKAIPDLLADANRRLEGIAKEMGSPQTVGALPQVALARRTLLLLQKRSVELEIREYEEELRYYEARNALLTARREEARMAAAAAQSAVAEWQQLVSQRRHAEIERQKQRAEQELRSAPAAVRELIQNNKALAEEWGTVGARIKTLQEEYKLVTEFTARLDKEFSELRNKEREDPEGLAEIVGPEMRRKREELALLRGYERDLRALKKESARVERRVWQIDEEALDLMDLRADVEEKVRDIVQAAPQVDETKIAKRVEELYVARRATLKQMQPDYHAYSEDMRELRAAYATALAKADQFRDFIDQHIFWLRSTGPVHTAKFPEGWLRRGPQWAAIGTSMSKDLLAHPALYVAAAIVMVVLLLPRRRIRSSVRDLSQLVSRSSSDRYGLTLLAAAWTVLLSLPWAVLMCFVGWRVGAAVDVTDPPSYELAQAVASGLFMAALVLWTLSLVRQVCRGTGIAQTHFRWDAKAVRLARKSLGWLSLFAVPITFMVYATERHTESAWRSSIGRSAFIAGMVILAVFLQRLLRPSTGILAKRLKRHKASWLYNLRYVWLPLVVLSPIALAAASAVGYHYTAVKFSEELMRTTWLLLGVLFLHAMLVRWLFVTQRKLAVEQARKKRVAAEVAKAAEKPQASEAIEIDEVSLDLVTIGDQAKKLLRSSAAFATVIGLWIIWADMLPALSFMGNIELWPYTVSAVETGTEGAAPEGGGAASTGRRVEYITLADVFLAIVIAMLTYILARNIPGLLEIAVLQKLPFDAGGTYAITALARYTIVVVGVIIAFGSVGVGWSKVQWLVAAMTVGLGFGLQEIFANFVSGLILLFERPIRIGDTVTVGTVSGIVTRIRIRATTITDWDRKELVIPNKEFVTGQVMNWTLSDSTLRIIVPAGIAYGSDTKLAERLLYEVARQTSRVLEDPKPKVWFMGFGESSLNFELRVFVSGVDDLLLTRHQLNMAIDAEFRNAGIEIAFPQRDIHVRSIREALPVTGKEPQLEKPEAAESERRTEHGQVV